MEFTAEQIAGLLNGNVEGNPEAMVNTLSKIEEGTLNSLSFLANLAYEEHLYTTDATIVIVNRDLELKTAIKSSCTLVRVEDAYQSFTKLLEVYNQFRNNKTGIEKQTFISESATVGEDIYLGAFGYISDNATIGDNVKIYPQTFIGENVTIGNNTLIYAGVKIYHDCVIGDNCIIHAGAVIGSDGFGFAPNKEGSFDKIPQIGNVIIENDVEIGPNNCIDRATMGSTVIKKGVKTDNLVHIAHNVVVGENTVLAGQTGISGSSKIGKNCMTGGQVGITGHITVGDNVKIAGQSGVSKNIKDNQVLQGSPAFSYTDYMRSYASFKNLPSIVNRINELENK
ncbi:MAG: UDP-3-O-(3-hydroxymyristoyl)glucosamine N-acyltransferase [Vicingaceae bacterium]|nr:UDP-3-O-(3-hydroxymyristoyl)glucosamine N-acyltransferase [Vicingaceae bacterium]